jgi:mRNA-degrading endonuclease RelE of RelBE toxin-antitoxin system
MKGLFVESSIFSKNRAAYLSEDAYRLLQMELLITPTKGDVIQGTGGLRKIRSSSKGSGKRGGVRIIYYYLDIFNRFYLLTLYAKNEMTDLTAQDKKHLKHFLEDWINEQA